MKHHAILTVVLALTSCTQGELYHEELSTDDPDKVIRIVYYTEDRRVCRVYFMSKDLRNGVEFGFQDSSVAWTSVRDHGERLNLYSYHDNGRPQTLTNFSDEHSRTGHIIEYHPNGAIETEGWLVNDERVGIWKEYDPTGAIVSIDTFGIFDRAHPGYPIAQ